jgi:steroid delta-isomerase-like uncharacterized protein
MSSTAPILTVHALFDALNDHDVDQAARCVDPSYHGVDATRSALTVGRDDARAEIRAGLTAFPDAGFTIEQCVTQPPVAFVYWTMEATHEASFLNLPTTHQPVSVSGTGLFTVQNRQIVHAVHLWDLAGLMRSVGLLPDVVGGGDPDDRSGRSASAE